jgi:hypothetical protein
MVHEAMHGRSGYAWATKNVNAYIFERHRFIEEGLVERRSRKVMANLFEARGHGQYVMDTLNIHGAYTEEALVFENYAKKFGEGAVDVLFNETNAELRWDTMINTVAQSVEKVFDDKDLARKFSRFMDGAKTSSRAGAHEGFNVMKKLIDILRILKESEKVVIQSPSGDMYRKSLERIFAGDFAR